MSWHTVTGVVTVRVSTNFHVASALGQTLEQAAALALHDYAFNHALGEEGRDYVVMVTSTAPKPPSPSEPDGKVIPTLAQAAGRTILGNPCDQYHGPLGEMGYDKGAKRTFYWCRYCDWQGWALEPAPSEPERLEAERKTWENRLPCE